MFEYNIFLYVAGNGPLVDRPFQTNTPVQIGHEIDWCWNKDDEEDEMTLEVFDISHRSGVTILFCSYDDIYSDEYLINTLLSFGVREDDAREAPAGVRKEREEKYAKKKAGIKVTATWVGDCPPKKG